MSGPESGSFERDFLISPPTEDGNRFIVPLRPDGRPPESSGDGDMGPEGA